LLIRNHPVKVFLNVTMQFQQTYAHYFLRRKGTEAFYSGAEWLKILMKKGFKIVL